MSTVALIGDSDALSVDSISDLSFAMEGFFDTSDSKLDAFCEPHSVFPMQSPEPVQQQKSAASLAVTNSTTTTANTTMMQPRMVSVCSLAQVSSSAVVPKSRQASPLDSLKALIAKKQENSYQQPSSNLKRPASRLTPGTRIASVFNKPSDFLRQAISESAAPASKRRRTSTTDADSELHLACRRGPDLTVEEVEAILAKDPMAAVRPLYMTTYKMVYNPVSCKLEPKLVPEKYQYPLNIAISYKASTEVIDRLTVAAPDVLEMPDGKSYSFHILLRHKPQDLPSADMLLLKKPAVVSQVDGKKNTPLHVAVFSGVAAQTVRHLVLLSPPEVILQPNFHGQTPWDLAQRYGHLCSSEVSDYLWKEVQQQF